MPDARLFITFDRSATPKDAESDPVSGESWVHILIAAPMSRRAPAALRASTRMKSPATMGNTLQETEPTMAITALRLTGAATAIAITAAAKVGSPRFTPRRDAEIKTTAASAIPQTARRPSGVSVVSSEPSSALPRRSCRATAVDRNCCDGRGCCCASLEKSRSSAVGVGGMSSAIALEKHYRVRELGELWGFSDNTIIRLFASEPGVIRLESAAGRRRYRGCKLDCVNGHRIEQTRRTDANRPDRHETDRHTFDRLQEAGRHYSQEWASQAMDQSSFGAGEACRTDRASGG